MIRVSTLVAAALWLAGCDSASRAGDAADLTDGAPRDAGPQLLPTAAVSICQWRGEQGTWMVEQGSSWMRYSCRQACAGLWRTCAGPTGVVDEHAQEPKVELPFVVGDMAGRLRMSDRSGPAIAIHSGGPGNYYLADGSLLSPASNALVHALETHAPVPFHVIEVKWESGAGGRGVMTPRSADPLDARASVVRSASLLRWIKTGLAGADKLGSVGCSGGAVQSLGAALWYEGVDGDLAYQLVASGPPANWDANTWCGGTPAPQGLCENDPATSCTADATCGDARNRCAYEVASDSAIAQTLRFLVDLQHGTPNTCVARQYSASFEADSFAFTPTRFGVTHRVDMYVSEGCNAAEGCDPNRHSIDDTKEGITGQMGRLFLALKAAGADVSWNDLHGYGHCDAILQPELMPAVVMRIAAGME